jgi:hypothetical protein
MEQNMEQSKEKPSADQISPDRREVIQKLGRFTAYAAPFTVLALTRKAASASTGPWHRH